ncbi:MAG: hypothetical protein K2N11_09630 [Mucispirillum sp.]|nr:hypothetical protein [Mucispirillum sp.]
MIINNSMYLNYLNTLQNPSNDINAADNDDDSTSAANSSENTPVTLPANMDSVNISSTTEVEAEVIEKPKFDWKYNTTDNGYLPDFKLGDWENTSDILFGSSTMTVEERSYAVYLPEKLQEKMKADPEFAKEINAKLEDFFNSAKRESGTLDDGSVYNVIAQQMAVAMDENGNITHTYVRTESYSISNALSEAANDENAIDTLDLNQDDSNTNSNSLTIKYGFAMYQSNIQIGSAGSKELSDEEKNSNAMSAIGVQAVITIETYQVSGSEPVTEIRKANGDVVELETGKLIQKHAGYSDGLQKYDTKA